MLSLYGLQSSDISTLVLASLKHPKAFNQNALQKNLIVLG